MSRVMPSHFIIFNSKLWYLDSSKSYYFKTFYFNIFRQEIIIGRVVLDPEGHKYSRHKISPTYKNIKFELLQLQHLLAVKTEKIESKITTNQQQRT